LTSPAWETARERTISKDTHHQNVDFNIFEGMTVKGVNTTTISQGKVVRHDGDVRSERGVGRYIERPATPQPIFCVGDRVMTDGRGRNRWDSGYFF